MPTEPSLIAVALVLGVSIQLATSAVRSVSELLAFCLPLGLAALALAAFTGTLLGVESPAGLGACAIAPLVFTLPLSARALWHDRSRNILWLVMGIVCLWLIALGLSSLRAANFQKMTHYVLLASHGVLDDDVLTTLRSAVRFESGSLSVYLQSFSSLIHGEFLITVSPLAMLSVCGVTALTVFRTARAFGVRRAPTIAVAALPTLLLLSSFPVVQAAFQHDGRALAAMLLVAIVAVGWLLRLDRTDRSWPLAMLIVAVPMTTSSSTIVVSALVVFGLIDPIAKHRRLAVLVTVATGLCFWEAALDLAKAPPAFSMLVPAVVLGVGLFVRVAVARPLWRRIGVEQRPQLQLALGHGLALALVIAIGAVVLTSSLGGAALNPSQWGGIFTIGLGLLVWASLRAPGQPSALALWIAVIVVVGSSSWLGKPASDASQMIIVGALASLLVGVSCAIAVTRFSFLHREESSSALATVAWTGISARYVVASAVVLLFGLHLAVNLVLLQGNLTRLSDQYQVWPPHDHFVYEHRK